MSTTKSNWAIIGRIPFDDENSIYCYVDMTLAEAEAEFRADILRDSDITDDDQNEDHIEMEDGKPVVYLMEALRSDSPITVDYCNY